MATGIIQLFLRAAALVVALLLSCPRPALAQADADDLASPCPPPAAEGPPADDTRTESSRAHQACLAAAWTGAGAACFRRWLAGYEEDASSAERASASRELAREGVEPRSIEAAGLLTVRDPSQRDVWVDGEPVGKAPLQRVPFAPGVHTVELRPSAGGATTREVILFAGQEDLVELGGGAAAAAPGTARTAPPAGGTTKGGVFDFCAPTNERSKRRVVMLAPAGGDQLERTSDLANVNAAELSRQVFAARFPLARFDNVVALEAGQAAWVEQETLTVGEVTGHLDRAAARLADLDEREAQFAAYSAACADDLVVPAVTEHTFEWVVTKVKDKKGRTTTIRSPKLEMTAKLAIFRRTGSRYSRVALLEASAPSFADVLSDVAIASMPTTGVAGMDTLDLVATAADAEQHLSAIPDAACLAANAPTEGVEALLRCAKHGTGRAELAVRAVDERLGPECTAARKGGGDPALVTCEVRARTFQLTRSLKKEARGVDGWRLSAPLGASRGDDVIALGEKEGIEVGYGFVALDGDGDRIGYYKVTEVGEDGHPSRVRPRAGSVEQGVVLHEYPQMGLTIGTVGFATGVLLNDGPTLVGDVPVGPAPWVAGGVLEMGYDLSGALGGVETWLRIDVGVGGGPGVNANTLVVPTAIWIEKGFYPGDRVTLFGAIGGGFQFVLVQIVENPGVEPQTLQAYGGGPGARAGLGIQLSPDLELRFEGVGSGSVVPASYDPEEGLDLPPGWSAREDRWFMVGGRAGLGVIL